MKCVVLFSGLYQLTSYRVHTKMMIVEEWYLEVKFQKIYRHSSIYAVNVGTHAESENHVNRGYLVVLKGRKI